MYPIDKVPCGRLAIMPRPRAGDWLAGEIESWQRSGVSCVVSLLEPSEVAELELQHEPELCGKAGIEFLQFPIADRGVPHSGEEVFVLVASLVRQLQDGRGVAIHCRAGIGRSALVAACVLAALGQPIESAWQSIQDARRLTVPDTPEQRTWVTTFCAEFAKHRGRSGAQ
jgi:protein-tyrosine phosphatase